MAEIGSLDINGSIRPFFKTDKYVGFDIAEGKGVDSVEQGQLIGSPTGHYDVTVSAECFEHNPFWVETFSNMLRMTKPGGLVIFSCATVGRPEHGTSRSTPNNSPLTVQAGWNYYLNLDAKDFLESFNMTGWFDGFHFLEGTQMKDLYFYGIRSGNKVNFSEQEFMSKAQALEQELHSLNESSRVIVWTPQTIMI